MEVFYMNVAEWMLKNCIEIIEYAKSHDLLQVCADINQLKEDIPRCVDGDYTEGIYTFCIAGNYVFTINNRLYFNPIMHAFYRYSPLKLDDYFICVCDKEGTPVTQNWYVDEVSSGIELCTILFEGFSSEYKYRYDVYRDGNFIVSLYGDNRDVVVKYFKKFDGKNIHSARQTDGSYIYTSIQDGKPFTFSVRRRARKG